jgi:hypothetical protein
MKDHNKSTENNTIKGMNTMENKNKYEFELKVNGELKDKGVIISYLLGNDGEFLDDLLEQIRFSLLFELYEQKVPKNTIEESKILLKEIMELLNKTPEQIREDHQLEVDEDGNLI